MLDWWGKWQRFLLTSLQILGRQQPKLCPDIKGLTQRHVSYFQIQCAHVIFSFLHFKSPVPHSEAGKVYWQDCLLYIWEYLPHLLCVCKWYFMSLCEVFIFDLNYNRNSLMSTIWNVCWIWCRQKIMFFSFLSMRSPERSMRSMRSSMRLPVAQVWWQNILLRNLSFLQWRRIKRRRIKINI